MDTIGFSVLPLLTAIKGLMLYRTKYGDSSMDVSGYVDDIKGLIPSEWGEKRNKVIFEDVAAKLERVHYGFGLDKPLQPYIFMSTRGPQAEGYTPFSYGDVLPDFQDTEIERGTVMAEVSNIIEGWIDENIEEVVEDGRMICHICRSMYPSMSSVLKHYYEEHVDGMLNAVIAMGKSNSPMFFDRFISCMMYPHIMTSLKRTSRSFSAIAASSLPRKTKEAVLNEDDVLNILGTTVHLEYTRRGGENLVKVPTSVVNEVYKKMLGKLERKEEFDIDNALHERLYGYKIKEDMAERIEREKKLFSSTTSGGMNEKQQTMRRTESERKIATLLGEKVVVNKKEVTKSVDLAPVKAKREKAQSAEDRVDSSERPVQTSRAEDSAGTETEVEAVGEIKEELSMEVQVKSSPGLSADSKQESHVEEISNAETQDSNAVVDQEAVRAAAVEKKNQDRKMRRKVRKEAASKIYDDVLTEVFEPLVRAALEEAIEKKKIEQKQREKDDSAESARKEEARKKKASPTDEEVNSNTGSDYDSEGGGDWKLVQRKRTGPSKQDQGEVHADNEDEVWRENPDEAISEVAFSSEPGVSSVTSISEEVIETNHGYNEQQLEETPAPEQIVSSEVVEPESEPEIIRPFSPVSPDVISNGGPNEVGDLKESSVNLREEANLLLQHQAMRAPKETQTQVWPESQRNLMVAEPERSPNPAYQERRGVEDLRVSSKFNEDLFAENARRKEEANQTKEQDPGIKEEQENVFAPAGDIFENFKFSDLDKIVAKKPLFTRNEQKTPKDFGFDSFSTVRIDDFPMSIDRFPEVIEFLSTAVDMRGIERSKIAFLPHTGMKSCFVELGSINDVSKACSLSGSVVKGNKLNVSAALEIQLGFGSLIKQPPGQSLGLPETISPKVASEADGSNETGLRRGFNLGTNTLEDTGMNRSESLIPAAYASPASTASSISDIGGEKRMKEVSHSLPSLNSPDYEESGSGFGSSGSDIQSLGLFDFAKEEDQHREYPVSKAEGSLSEIGGTRLNVFEGIRMHESTDTSAADIYPVSDHIPDEEMAEERVEGEPNWLGANLFTERLLWDMTEDWGASDE